MPPHKAKRRKKGYGPKPVLDFFRAPEKAVKAIETPIKDHELDKFLPLKNQLSILEARHRFVAQQESAADIAVALSIKRSTYWTGSPATAGEPCATSAPSCESWASW